jgi:precorrin-6B methylase 2
MRMPVRFRRTGAALVAGVFAASGTVVPYAVLAQTGQRSGQKPFEPYSGQPGKDVVWVPTPQPLVEKMLDMAQVGPNDYHMDLGSGDGRTVITAAKRGATAVGIEYNPDMVELSRRLAKEAGVTAKATFMRGDLFEADLSKATVITLFLLPSINMKLRPKILDLKPGTRIVSNTFTMEDWVADATEEVGGDCVSWCTALLWYVPAKVAGRWQLADQTLTLTQEFQMLSGTLGSQSVTEGRLKGEEITFTAGGVTYTGRVSGNTMSGRMAGSRTGNWTATKR